MSRIGNRALTIPEGVTVTVDNIITVKGPKGELSLNKPESVKVEIKDNNIITTPANNSKEASIMVGTTNSHLNNMITGVTQGFSKGLEAVGVGYRFKVNGSKIDITAGFSHPVIVDVPNGLSVEQVSNTEITINGIDNQQVNEFAAIVRKIREPEPYKGKGIRYKDEIIRRKEGKKAAK